MDELIVFLMREFKWSLEYTVNLVNTLPTKKLNALVKELRYQKSLEDYKMASNFALILSNWASSKGKRRYRITDFIGDSPERKEGKKSIWSMAEQKGIKIPKGVL